MEGGKGGKLDEWKGGKVEEWKGGRVESWNTNLRLGYAG